MLVPTTLRHSSTTRIFRDRFADWPVRVEVISRFKAKKEIDAALAKLRDGQIDVMIGTHRLLQEDVKFKALGLVIIDEEHRFGVRQKERLKKLRAEVDVLTLTATPIPRTLNMAMSGMRDLSIIATPPEHRLAVKTFIAQYDLYARRSSANSRAVDRFISCTTKSNQSNARRAILPRWSRMRACASPTVRCRNASWNR